MNELQELLTRGVSNIIPNKEELQEKLSKGEKLNVYLGIDPTAVNIHLGHAVTLRKLQKFAELGHNVTFLVGDFTAKIGDTSDKESERPQISDEQIQENLKTYKEQAQKIIDFDKVNIRYNSEWLKGLNFEDIIKLASKFSLNDFIGRELIKKRLDEGKSVSLLETIYPVMQGYDSMILDTDIQIGGTDQTFNMQAGRKLLQNKKESFVITTEFLSGTDGRKMSKTWGNAIWLTEEPNEIFGKVMSITDDVIIEYFTLATNTPFEEIEELKQEVDSDPMNLKKKLAHRIVAELHNESEAGMAQDNFEKTIQHGETPENIEQVGADSGTSVLDFIVNNNLSDSKSEAKRLIEQGGVVYNGERVDYSTPITEGGILRVGRRSYVKVNVR